MSPKKPQRRSVVLSYELGPTCGQVPDPFRGHFVPLLACPVLGDTVRNLAAETERRSARA